MRRVRVQIQSMLSHTDTIRSVVCLTTRPAIDRHRGGRWLKSRLTYGWSGEPTQFSSGAFNKPNTFLLERSYCLDRTRFWTRVRLRVFNEQHRDIVGSEHVPVETGISGATRQRPPAVGIEATDFGFAGQRFGTDRLGVCPNPLEVVARHPLHRRATLPTLERQSQFAVQAS